MRAILRVAQTTLALVVCAGVMVQAGAAARRCPADPTLPGVTAKVGAPPAGLATGVGSGAPERSTHPPVAAKHGAHAAGSAGSRSKAAVGAAGEFAGFDRNEYPGDAALPVLRRYFSFVGYWLNVPPGARTNGWAGRRATLVHAGFGFLVLWNGRTDAELRKAPAGGAPTVQLGGRIAAAARRMGERDGGAAVAAARTEHFPAGTLIFLDQEEGGRMLPEQAAYLLAWTEAVARGGDRPGVYGSGQPVPDGPGKTITTASDIRLQVKAGGLHPVAMWVYQDACPPSNGCSLKPPALHRSGTAGADVWQYAQSPRRPELTRACARTYAADGLCYVPELPGVALDLDVARRADPSGAR